MLYEGAPKDWACEVLVCEANRNPYGETLPWPETLFCFYKKYLKLRGTQRVSLPHPYARICSAAASHGFLGAQRRQPPFPLSLLELGFAGAAAQHC